MGAVDPYPPINTLKPLGPDIWIADGPVIDMRYVLGSLPFSTRMTLVRLPSGALWAHSPTPLTPGLKAEVEALGEPRYLIAPNLLHWSWLSEWRAAFPQADIHAAPGVEAKEQAGGFMVDFVLGDAPPPLWADAIDQALVPGAFMTEAEFFHRPSRTLILTDLIENFEPDHVHGPLLTLLMRIGGVMAPRSATPRDLRLTFLPRRKQVRAAAERIIAWAPDRIVISHGATIEQDATARLKRALAWTGA